jgi:hypothetical protein
MHSFKSNELVGYTSDTSLALMLAIWLPLVVASVKACLIAGSVIVKVSSFQFDAHTKYDPFSSTTELVGIMCAIVISVPLWIPAYLLPPTPCSPIVMLIANGGNSTLGIAGLCILCSILITLCFSLILVSWDIWRRAGRPMTQRRASRLADFDRAEVEVYNSNRSQDVAARKTFIYYSLGIFCLYVLP